MPKLSEMLGNAYDNHDRMRLPALTIYQGIAARTRYFLEFGQGNQVILYSSSRGVLCPSALASRDQVVNFGSIIDDLSFSGRHRDCLYNPSWRNFYHVDKRRLLRIDRAGQPIDEPFAFPLTDESSRFEWELCVPCLKCFFVFPLKNIEIEHQYSLSGMREAPVCKVFQAIGLAVIVSYEGKEIYLYDKFAHRVGGYTGLGDVDVKRRFTLNLQGTLFYSLVAAVGKQEELRKLCLNHFFNLRPLCHACRRTK